MIKQMMMQPEDLQSFLEHGFDEARLYGLKMASSPSDVRDFCSSITSPEDSSMISSNSYFHTMSSGNFTTLSDHLGNNMQILVPIENISQHVEGIEGISGSELDDVLRWWDESEELMDNISSQDSMENKMALMPLDDAMEEVEGETSLHHLVIAYGEAMEMGQRELAEVIIGCISEKASPLGGTMERVAFSLFHSGNQGDYIKQESMKSFKSAFKAFYEIFPYGRFSHFAANSAILEAIMMSNSRKVLHIVDFDMGEGVQWPPMLDAIGKLRKDAKLTSIRRPNFEQSCSFEETKRRLVDYANASGLNLEVQEITMKDLVKEVEGSQEREVLAFNCMVGLPHMRRRRNRSEVMEFFRVAKHLLSTNEGIITFGDGEDIERTKCCGNFSSFFDECVTHYHALCESMEENFPEKLTEARIAMESLFVAPYVSSLDWHNKWENINIIREDCEFKENIGLMGWSLSKESVMEAKEMVKERESLYNIRVGGQNGNEMVLEWRGTPLVKVSVWK